MVIDSMQLIRSYADKFNAHDAEGCGALAAEDGKFTDMVLGIEGDGPSGLRDWTQIWLTAFPDATIEIVSSFASGDAVVSEGMFRGTQTGALVTPMGTIPPTGKRLEGYYCNVSRVRDGKLSVGRQYYDGLGLLRQLGIGAGVGVAPEAQPSP